MVELDFLADPQRIGRSTSLCSAISTLECPPPGARIPRETRCDPETHRQLCLPTKTETKERLKLAVMRAGGLGARLGSDVNRERSCAVVDQGDRRGCTPKPRPRSTTRAPHPCRPAA